MKFIVIEGIDGSGKSTQINMLKQHLNNKKIKYKFLHFPRTGSLVYGDLIARFLRGEFGDLNTVNPYLVALIYAGDRNDAKTKIRNWLNEGNVVIVDRYVKSNIAFQCAKILSAEEKNKLKNWILFLEFQYNKIPKPDISIFLDVPFDFTSKNLTKKRLGEDRNYLNGKSDIHETDLDFQKKVKEEYLSMVREDKSFYLIECRKEKDTVLDPEDIFKKIISILPLGTR